MIRQVAILDLETGGLALTDPVVEVGCVLYSVQSACIVECFSSLIWAESNQAEAINGIPIDAVKCAPSPSDVWPRVRDLLERADVACAHRSEFDQPRLPEGLRNLRPFVCTKFDIKWPRVELGASLTETALAHGLGISHAHRALTDCLTIARLFDRVRELGHDVGAMLERGLRPKAKFMAIVSYDERALAKENSFTWEASSKRWLRTMARDDVASLPFDVEEVV